MNFRKLNIGQRLASVFAVLIALFLGVAVMADVDTAAVAASMSTITEVNNTETDLAIAMRVTVSSRMIALRNVVLLRDEQDIDREIAAIGKLADTYADTERRLDALLDQHAAGTAERAELGRATAAAREAAPIMEAVIAAGRAGRDEEATRLLMQRLLPVQKRWSAALTRFGEVKDDENRVLLEQAHTLRRNIRYQLLGVALLAALCAALLGWRITRSITVPLREAVALARRVAAGDLAASADQQGRDEPAELMRALNEMTDSLRRVIGAVGGSADTVRSASADIAAGNLDLSGRTEDQASSLQQTAAAMEQLTSAVRNNADNAGQADGLARVAAEVAERGGHAVRAMVTTMEDIDGAARRVTDIIGVIDGIAFQTNILALNAAVEAARAGEQGRGFAVVASEVRGLAQRSAAAAREIKDVIDNAIGRVADGRRQAGHAGATMEQAVEGIRRVSTLMTEISRASLEQSAGIGQVNHAIASMDTVTQQNAALVEQAAAAAAALREEADQLAAAVARFRTGAAVPKPDPEVPAMPARDIMPRGAPARPARRPLAQPGAHRQAGMDAPRRSAAFARTAASNSSTGIGLPNR